MPHPVKTIGYGGISVTSGNLLKHGFVIRRRNEGDVQAEAFAKPVKRCLLNRTFQNKNSFSLKIKYGMDIVPLRSVYQIPGGQDRHFVKSKYFLALRRV